MLLSLYLVKKLEVKRTIFFFFDYHCDCTCLKLFFKVEEGIKIDGVLNLQKIRCEEWTGTPHNRSGWRNIGDALILHLTRTS